MAGLSYDSQDILTDFARRRGITYPLLADPQSTLIRRLGVLNAAATGRGHGMAHPGLVYVDADGRVRETFFEGSYQDRFTANSVLARLVPELAADAVRTVPAPLLRIDLAQSDLTAAPGSRITLVVDVRMPAGLHVYAAGAHSYQPLALRLEGGDYAARDVRYPDPVTLALPAIGEKVPVYTDQARVTHEVVMRADADFLRQPGDRTVTIRGTLSYQACDDRVCYPPAEVPVSWEVRMAPLDLDRSPEEIRHPER